MRPFRPADLAIVSEKNGSHQYIKNQPPRPVSAGMLKSGRGDYEFQFDLNGHIKFIRGLGSTWPHPFETLKRTAGNDWVLLHRRCGY